MDLKLRLQRVLQIVEEAEHAGALSDIERDIVLGELREVYSEVKFGGAEAEKAQVESVEDTVKDEVVVENNDALEEQLAEPELEEAESDEPEVEFEIIFSEEDDELEDVVEEPQQQEEPQLQTEEKCVAEVEPVVEQPVEVEQKKEEAPVVESQQSISASRRSPILSLYEDAAPTVVGEQFVETRSVADTIVCSKGVAESTSVRTLRESISVADKFMLIRELFNGDAEMYEVAIDSLEGIATFEDCVIYIAENYTWNAQSDGAKFMMELLQRKYNA